MLMDGNQERIMNVLQQPTNKCNSAEMKSSKAYFNVEKMFRYSFQKLGNLIENRNLIGNLFRG
jgi:hypothetical protein